MTVTIWRIDLLGRNLRDLVDIVTSSPNTGLDTSLRPFHDRPAPVLSAGRFAAAALKHVKDPLLTRLPLVGSVDQLLDYADALAHPALTSHMCCYYDALAAENPR